MRAASPTDPEPKGQTLTTPGSLRYSQPPQDPRRIGDKGKQLINR
jgi:hypothetical protein